MDTNIKNYTISELAAILKLDDLSDVTEIEKKTDNYIDKYVNERNATMINFFKEMQKVLLENAYTEIENEGQQEQWQIREGTIPQKNAIQADKITDRIDKVDILEHGKHYPMTRKQLGVANNFIVDTAQDTLNPTLKNTIDRMICIDSRYRQESAENISTDFTLDLSDPLKNVLSLRLYSIQIPYTWYIINDIYQNKCMWIHDGSYYVAVTISSGNYNASQFVTELTHSFALAGFTFTTAPVVYKDTTSKLTFFLNGGVYTDPSDPSKTFTINEVTTSIILFDHTFSLECNSASSCKPYISFINQTLGWLMGFRTSFEKILSSGNTCQSILDLNGPQYLILVVDDFNQNHLNSGLIGITQQSNRINLPSYYSPDLPFVCTEVTYTNSSINTLETETVEQLLPSAPRTLTNSQIYTINQIIKNNNAAAVNMRLRAPEATDTFAIIPIKQGTDPGNFLIDINSMFKDNRRTYFGPVDIERLRVRLLDDKGYDLDLNGCEWSFILIAECLYQY